MRTVTVDRNEHQNAYPHAQNRRKKQKKKNTKRTVHGLVIVIALLGLILAAVFCLLRFGVHRQPEREEVLQSVSVSLDISERIFTAEEEEGVNGYLCDEKYGRIPGSQRGLSESF